MKKYYLENILVEADNSTLKIYTEKYNNYEGIPYYSSPNLLSEYKYGDVVYEFLSLENSLRTNGNTEISHKFMSLFDISDGAQLDELYDMVKEALITDTAFYNSSETKTKKSQYPTEALIPRLFFTKLMRYKAVNTDDIAYDDFMDNTILEEFYDGWWYCERRNYQVEFRWMSDSSFKQVYVVHSLVELLALDYFLYTTDKNRTGRIGYCLNCNKLFKRDRMDALFCTSSCAVKFNANRLNSYQKKYRYLRKRISEGYFGEEETPEFTVRKIWRDESKKLIDDIIKGKIHITEDEFVSQLRSRFQALCIEYDVLPAYKGDKYL